MPTFNLTFHYQSRSDRIVGRATVQADTLDKAARRVAAARGLSQVWVRTCNEEPVRRWAGARLDLAGLVRAGQLVPAARALQERLNYC